MKRPIKNCKNPECGDEIIDYKSSKREYCCDYCRNHHGYVRRIEENKEFTKHKNGLQNNYKVLKMHSDAGIFKESLSKYEKFGFDPAYLPVKKIYKKDGKIIEYFILKDIKFRFQLEDNSIIILN